MNLNRREQMALFITVVITIYTLTNLWLLMKGYRALAGAGHNTGWYTTIFITLSSAFILGKLLEHSYSGLITDILNVAGGFWLAFMLYGFLAWVAADLLLLILKPFGVIPDTVMPILRLRLFTGITVAITLLIITGFIIALRPVTTNYDIDIDKPLSDNNNEMRIVAVSDIHLGSIIRKRSMRRLSVMIEKEKPDLILFLGDLIDGSIGPVLRGDLLSSLTLPESRYGTWAITGNHEYIGNYEVTVPYIESRGIEVLKDEVKVLENGVQLVGRLDRSARPGAGGHRKSLEELLERCDPQAPVIILDHQPSDLAALTGSAADLQLSGHTHNGQIWPLSLITRHLFEVSYGHGIFGKTNVLVSSGFGIWGPRMRLGTRAEILSVTLRGRPLP